MSTEDRSVWEKLSKEAKSTILTSRENRGRRGSQHDRRNDRRNDRTSDPTKKRLASAHEIEQETNAKLEVGTHNVVPVKESNSLLDCLTSSSPQVELSLIHI